MSYVRYVVRIEQTDLDQFEQEQFVNDVDAQVQNYDIGGTFIDGHGWGWLDFEGYEEDVEDVLIEVVNDDRVVDYEILDQKTVEQRALDYWFAGHGGIEFEPGNIQVVREVYTEPE